PARGRRVQPGSCKRNAFPGPPAAEDTSCRRNEIAGLPVGSLIRCVPRSKRDKISKNLLSRLDFERYAEYNRDCSTSLRAVSASRDFELRACIHPAGAPPGM